MDKWKTVQDSRKERPEEIDTTSSSNVVYERRNIRRETVAVANGETETTMEQWIYEQSTWLREDYMRMQQELDSPATRAIMQSISDLQLEVAMSSAGLEV